MLVYSDDTRGMGEAHESEHRAGAEVRFAAGDVQCGDCVLQECVSAVLGLLWKCESDTYVLQGRVGGEVLDWDDGFLLQGFVFILHC